MTPELFQDALIEDIQHTLSQREYLNTLGEKVHLTMYAQSLPVEQSDDDKDPVPWCIVRITDGNVSGDSEGFYEVKSVVIFGLYNPDPSCQGHRDLLSAINLVYERFSKNPMLDGRYTFLPDRGFHWTLQEDGYFPYFFGAVEMTFAIPKIRREDEFT